MDLAELLRSADRQWCDAQAEAVLWDELERLSSVESRLAAARHTIRQSIADRQPSGCGHDAADDAKASDTTGDSSSRSRAERERATALIGLELVQAAFAAGELTVDHVEAFARVPMALRDVLLQDEAQLVDEARAMAADAFGVRMRSWRRRQAARSKIDQADQQRAERRLAFRLDAESGMWKLFGELDPVTAAAVKKAVRRAYERLVSEDDRRGATDRPSHRQRMADALREVCLEYVGMAEDRPAAGNAGTNDRCHDIHPGDQLPAAPVVLIDLQTLFDGPHDSGRCELPGLGPVPLAAVREAACRLGVRPMVLDQHGVPLYLGRVARFATAGQRLALRAQYGTCVGPGCEAPIDDCAVHHLVRWEDGGPTDLDNLVPLCPAHHSMAHDTPWSVQRDRVTGQVTWVPPP